MTKYELIIYDLWGNRRDGWTVNNAFRTGIIIELENPETASNMLINRKLQSRDILWGGDPDYTLYGVNRSGKPIAELMKIESATTNQEVI